MNPPNGQNISLPKRAELKAGAGGTGNRLRSYNYGGGGGGVIIKGQKPVREKPAGDGFGAGGGVDSENKYGKRVGRSGAVLIKIGK